MAAALPIVGCGDGDSTAADGGGEEIAVQTSSLSKPQFIKRADAMCRSTKQQALGEFRQYVEQGREKGKSEEAASGEVVETILVPGYEEMIEEFVALGAPSGDEQQVARFLDTLRETLELAEEDPSEAINSLNNPFKRAAELAKKYGLTGCAGSLA